MPAGLKPADLGVAVGQVFLGKYRVDAILGHGGMGVVASCTHLALGERVAIKMLRPDVLGDHDAVQRFSREAQAAAKLKSEYVARVTDVGVFENGVPYMVMEFLDGYDLGKMLEQRGVLPVAWTTELILQTAEALAEAHALGIVHRDVKPTNLFVSWRPDGTSLIKVLDFGISKSPTGADMQLTQTQSLLGTPAYMSPEQMRSARLVDSRSDIWSLGTVMYEMLEGRRPFEAESFSEMCVKVAVDPPSPMVNAPASLQQVIMRCLAKAPEQRYPSMADLGRDLVPFAQDPHAAQLIVDRMARMLRRGQDWEGGSTGTGRRALPSTPNPWSVGTEPSGVSLAAHPASPPRAASGLTNIPQPTTKVRRARWPIVIGTLGLLAAGGGAAVYLTNQSDDAAPVKMAPAAAPTAPVLAPPPPVVPAITDHAADTKPPEPKPPEPKPLDPKPADGKPPVSDQDAKAAEAKAQEQKHRRELIRSGAGKPAVAHAPPTKLIKPDEAKPTKPDEARPTKPDEAKPTKPDAAEPATVKPPVKAAGSGSGCDAFASLHGCK